MNDMRATIVRLLSNMASAREIQLYLKRFSQQEAARFAVVRVGGAVLRDDLEALVSSLAFLQQVGLTPIVVHGPGPWLDEAMTAAGVDAPLLDDIRYTSPEALAIVRRVLQSVNLRLVESLQAAGVRATSIQTGVFEAELLGRRKYGLVGRVARVHTAAIDAAVAVRSIPVIAAVGETADGQIVSLQSNVAADALVLELKPYKIIFLNREGGLFDDRGRRVESISLRTEYPELADRMGLPPAVRAQLDRIQALLTKLPPSTSLSITKPDDVAKELFTHRGSGTLIRYGERIQRFSSWRRVDTQRLRSLIESSFGRALSADYFERTRPYRIYISEQYRAALVLLRVRGLVYMDKFAVSDEAQGEGLGRALWRVMREETPQLFWRSRRGNAINEFYFERADGAVRDDRWTVFWYGLTDWKAIRFAVEHARSREITIA